MGSIWNPSLVPLEALMSLNSIDPLDAVSNCYVAPMCKSHLCISAKCRDRPICGNTVPQRLALNGIV